MVKRQFIRGVILSFSLAATPLLAATPTTVVIGTLPQPGWDELSTQQKIILAPLSKDWERMENIRKRKWIGIADRYAGMKPDEQIRTQDRMREWSRLTPEQRAKIRDSYKDFKQLPAEQKKAVRQKWEAYSNLPAEEKQRVRAEGKSAKLLTPIPAAIENGTAEASANLQTQPPAAPFQK